MEKTAKMKCVHDVSSRLKDKCESMKDEMTAFKDECELMQQTSENLKKAIEEDTLTELAAKCKKGKKKTVKDCYETAYEPIKADGIGGAGGQGCCTVF